MYTIYFAQTSSSGSISKSSQTPFWSFKTIYFTILKIYFIFMTYLFLFCMHLCFVCMHVDARVLASLELEL